MLGYSSIITFPIPLHSYSLYAGQKGTLFFTSETYILNILSLQYYHYQYSLLSLCISFVSSQLPVSCIFSVTPRMQPESLITIVNLNSGFLLFRFYHYLSFALLTTNFVHNPAPCSDFLLYIFNIPIHLLLFYVLYYMFSQLPKHKFNICVKVES